jgi:hypothetical protein
MILLHGANPDRMKFSLGGARFPPIAFDPAQISSRCDFPGSPELGAVNPHAVHDHGQPTRQRHDRLFHPAMPGDLHRPGLEMAMAFD